MYVGLKQPRGDGERYVTPARAAAKETIVRYDCRSLENCLQQRLIFYETPVFQHYLFKFLSRRVV